MRGRFIVLECIDSVMLAEQAGLLDSWLRSEVSSVLLTREPTDGPVGSLARLMLNERLQVESSTRAALFVSDRLDHLYGIPGPDGQLGTGFMNDLKDGAWVICMRYLLSTYVYQSSDNIPLDWLRKINRPCLWPDLMIFIDAPVEKWLNRQVKLEGYDNLEYLEKQSRALAAQRERYLEVIGDCEHHGERVLLIDGNQPVNSIHRLCRRAVEQLGVER